MFTFKFTCKYRNEEYYDVVYNRGYGKGEVVAIDGIARIRTLEPSHKANDNINEVLVAFNEWRAEQYKKEIDECFRRGLITEADMHLYPAPLVCTLEV